MKSTDSQSSMERLIQHFAGWVLYPLGDLVGQIIMHDVSLARYLTIMFVGGVIYRFEIPRWFSFLDRYRINKSTLNKYKFLKVFLHTEPAETEESVTKFNWLGKTLGAALFFNPLWIARHLFFISIAAAGFSNIDLGATCLRVLQAGSISFLTNLPIALVGNYIIQEHTSLKYRFMGSAILTTILNAKYAIEFVLMGG